MFVTSDQERQYLFELLRSAHTALMHQLHRADSLSYRQQLRKTVKLNEVLTDSIDEFDPQHNEYLLDLLRSAHTELLHQIHRADSIEFRNQLREAILTNELLTQKLDAEAEVAV